MFQFLTIHCVYEGFNFSKCWVPFPFCSSTLDLLLHVCSLLYFPIRQSIDLSASLITSWILVISYEEFVKNCRNHDIDLVQFDKLHAPDWIRITLSVYKNSFNPLIVCLVSVYVNWKQTRKSICLIITFAIYVFRCDVKVKSLSKWVSEWVSIGSSTSQWTIFQVYIWQHIDVQADRGRSWTYSRTPTP